MGNSTETTAILEPTQHGKGMFNTMKINTMQNQTLQRELNTEISPAREKKQIRKTYAEPTPHKGKQNRTHRNSRTHPPQTGS